MGNLDDGIRGSSEGKRAQRRVMLTLRLELRIHSEIERGDNAMVKSGGYRITEATGQCCSI